MESKVKDALVKYLREKYNCHSIILYGSYAAGDYSNESDIDIVCFCDNTNKKNDMSVIYNRQLDAWIYDTREMSKYDRFLHIKDGEVLLDERNMCSKLLLEIDKKITKGPKLLSTDEINFNKAWLLKMLNRTRKDDIEGNYRYHWLLTDSLEIYFNIRGIWYFGPKKSLKWLYDNDRDAYYLFQDALSINGSFTKVNKLIEHIIKLM